MLEYFWKSICFSTSPILLPSAGIFFLVFWSSTPPNACEGGTTLFAVSSFRVSCFVCLHLNSRKCGHIFREKLVSRNKFFPVSSVFRRERFLSETQRKFSAKNIFSSIVWMALECFTVFFLVSWLNQLDLDTVFCTYIEFEWWSEEQKGRFKENFYGLWGSREL